MQENAKNKIYVANTECNFANYATNTQDTVTVFHCDAKIIGSIKIDIH